MEHVYKKDNTPQKTLMPAEHPERPWQKMDSDPFVLGAQTYLGVLYYLFRYFEMPQLAHNCSTDTVVHLKSLFTFHDIPEVLCTDNGPQYSSQAFDSFATAYGFKHITNSPRYLQGNLGS